jgi:hypothetical protein
MYVWALTYYDQSATLADIFATEALALEAQASKAIPEKYGVAQWYVTGSKLAKAGTDA